jgi:peptidoglycan/xylan/chitin deacetylase (PgdA/CDA1 family)
MTAFGVKIARKVGDFGKRRVSQVWPQGVASFTFDDFPKSALTTGGAILERHGARGTFYAACGLAGMEGPLGPMFDAGDICAARHRGHEIACHTYSHRDCAAADVPAMQAEIRGNAVAMAAIAGVAAPASFSYPFGRVSAASRKILGRAFASCRGIQPGINQGVPDYAELRANKIYASQFSKEALCRLVDRSRAAGGWLIFYTHDVTEAPSAYGCTGGQLDAVVAYAAARMPILPVGDVVFRLGAARRHRAAGHDKSQIASSAIESGF